MSFIKKFLGLNQYVSPLDQFLEKFDQSHPKLSRSQRAEFEKYQKIYNLRDKPSEVEPSKDKLWNNF